MSVQSLERLKAEANVLFNRGKFNAAKEIYTTALLEGDRGKAPELRGVCSLLLSNRAACHKALGAWSLVSSDARAALELDERNFRASLLLGEFLAQRRLWRPAVARFERALELARRGGRPRAVLEEVEGALVSARSSWWEAAQAGEAHGDLELEFALGLALRVHYEAAPERGAWGLPGSVDGGGAVSRYDTGRVPVDAAVEAAAEAAAEAGAEAAAEAGAAAEGGGGGAPAGGAVGAPLPLEARLDAVGAVFHARAAAREARNVPEHFCCPVSLEVMLDPVVTPTGTSFERGALEACLMRKEEDPLTRAPLTAAQLVPNLGLRAAVAAWLAENPWAHPRRGR